MAIPFPTTGNSRWGAARAVDEHALPRLVVTGIVLSSSPTMTVSAYSAPDDVYGKALRGWAERYFLNELLAMVPMTRHLGR